MSIATALSAQRRRHGFPANEVAARARTSPAALSHIEAGRRLPRIDLAERIAEAMGSRIVVLPGARGRRGPAEIVDDIRHDLAQAHHDWAFRRLIQLSDDLRAVDPFVAAVLSAERPEHTGSALFDAGLAAVTAQALATRDMPTPSWTREPDRYLAESTYLPDPQAPFDLRDDEVPDEFAARNVRVHRLDLESV
ncbi:helix-turn-helix domain-containing protein [Microbacterium sp. No. 7]|uniref:helix-turn-helix domain-containing protein n=1 Tax=Microbacterium sp. No. 7 TaxID=1714373 RepID=UPI0006D1D5E9|nr:helix-turn-helix transcriptional regulator [Microbacterium sp. No. 7]